MARIRLPQADGSLVIYATGHPSAYSRPTAKLTSRRAFAAAHVVADPLADNTPGSPARLDWDATLAFRRYLWSWGLSVAEAMDTAQRGMGLDWDTTRELITRSVKESVAEGGGIACGANTDQLPPGPAELDRIVDAYQEQVSVIEDAGGQAVVMASRHLAAAGRDADDYLTVYGQVLAAATRPVIVHWLGDMFDPALTGYWGGTTIDSATEGFLSVLADNVDAVDGVKISLLDKDVEVELRRLLPDGIRMYTGDDFNYPETIGGDGERHSHAFLGAFAVIAPAASAAIRALDADDPAGFQAIMEPTLELSRHVFSHPTFYYKTGVVFMAYLNGHQEHFRMVHGLESARSVLHLTRQFELADRTGLLDDPDLAAARMTSYLALAGVDPV